MITDFAETGGSISPLPTTHTDERLKSSAAPNKINNIQALRAFAAIAVVFYHTDYIIGAHPIGAFGVDVFFVISGFIMARICDKNPQFFFRRRLIRIVPPYWFLTILLFFAARLFPALMGFTRPILGQLVKSLIFIPFFKSRGNIQPLLFLGWSLNAEMFFYICISLGLLLFRRHALLFASIVILLTTVISQEFGRGDAITQFFARGILLEFPLGVLAYHFISKNSHAKLRRLRLLLVAGVAASVAVLVAVEAFGLQPSHAPWIPDAVASFVLILSAAGLSKAGWDTKSVWIVLIGDSSYVLYLIHPYCLFPIARLLASHAPWLNITHLSGSLIASLLSIAIAVILHLKAELPVVAYLNNRFGGHRQSAEFKSAT
jgi:exopolysaccharide production protein ExoZ